MRTMPRILTVAAFLWAPGLLLGQTIPLAPGADPIAEETPTFVTPEEVSAGPAEPLDASPIIPLITLGDGLSYSLPIQSRGSAQVADPTEPTQKMLTLPLMPADVPVPRTASVGASMPEPGIFRLTGERAGAGFIIRVPKGMTLAGDFILSLRSSINVLPERSQLVISANGGAETAVTLDSFSGFSEVPVRLAGLKPGLNRIRVDVRHFHRIYCGPNATYAVWSDLALGFSGLRVPADALEETVEGFIAAVSNVVAQGLPVEIQTAPGTDEKLVIDIARGIRAAVGLQPRFRTSSYYGVGAGDAPAKVTVLQSDQDKISVRRGATGTMTLLIEHRARRLPDLGKVLPVRQSLSPLPSLVPGRLTKLSALGAPLILGNSYYFKQDVRFLLPQDWLLLASQKAELTLVYGFARDLPDESLLLVKMNGQTVQMLPLDRNGGEVRPPLEISFLASLMRAGANTLSFEMIIPAEAEHLQCPARSTDMLAILGDTTLLVPLSPAMRQRDLRVSLGVLSGTEIASAAPESDMDRGALLPLQTLLDPLYEQAGGTRLSVVTTRDLHRVPLREHGISRDLVDAALSPMRARRSASSGVVKEPAANGAPATPGFQLDEETAKDPSAIEDTAVSALHGPIAAIGNVARLLIGRAQTSLVPGGVGIETWLDGRQGDAILLQLNPKDEGDLWLILGPRANIPDIAFKVDAFRRDAALGSGSQVALLTSDGTWASWSDDWRPALLEDLSIANIRAVLGNYAAWSPIGFTSATLLLALLSILPALAFVLRTRRPGSRV